MKNNIDIKHIRELLKRYYRAETTRSEEDLLEAFFCDTSDADIPADLYADMRLFQAMREAHLQPEDIDMPSDMQFDIDGIVNRIVAGVPSKTEKKHRYRWIVSISGIAAAAILLFMIFRFVPDNNKNLSTSVSTKYAAKVDIGLDTESSVAEVPTVVAAETFENRKSEDRRVIKSHKSRKGGEIVANRNSESETVVEEDGFIEITDPEKVQEIVFLIEKHLKKNADKTNDAIASIGLSLDSYKEITKSIL